MDLLLEKHFLSTKDASELSGYHADYLGRLCRAGKLASERMGRAWLVERESLTLFMSSQEERKRDIARELSYKREREYQQAVTGASTGALARVAVNDLNAQEAKTEKSILSLLIRLSQGSSIVLRQSVLAVVTVAVIGISAHVAYSNTLSQMTNSVFTLANTLHGGLSAAVASINTDASRQVAVEQMKADAANPFYTILPSMHADASAQQFSRVANTLSVASLTDETISYQTEPNVPDPIDENNSHSNATVAVPVFPLTDALRDPRALASSVKNKSIHAYVLVGEREVAFTYGTLNAYVDVVHRASDGLLSIGTNTRDTTVVLPRISANIIALYERGITLWVVNTPNIPPHALALVYTTGDAVSSYTTLAITKTPALYDLGTAVIAQAIPSILNTGTHAEIAFGMAVESTISGSLEAQADAVAYTTHTVGEVGVAKGSELATNTSIITNAAYDLWLGGAGTAAVALNSANSESPVHLVATPISTLPSSLKDVIPSTIDSVLSFFSQSFTFVISELMPSTHTGVACVVPTTTDVSMALRGGDQHNSGNVAVLLERSFGRHSGNQNGKITASALHAVTPLNAHIENGSVTGDMLTISGSTMLGATLSTNVVHKKNSELRVSGDTRGYSARASVSAAVNIAFSDTFTALYHDRKDTSDLQVAKDLSTKNVRTALMTNAPSMEKVDPVLSMGENTALRLDPSKHLTTTTAARAVPAAVSLSVITSTYTGSTYDVSQSRTAMAPYTNLNGDEALASLPIMIGETAYAGREIGSKASSAPISMIQSTTSRTLDPPVPRVSTNKSTGTKDPMLLPVIAVLGSADPPRAGYDST